MISLRILYIALSLSFATHLKGQQIVQASGYSIPVYTFNQIEPILHPVANDTTYVINFWTTWCAPCIKELPYFEQIGSKYASDKVKVILVSLDFKNQIESRVIPFIQRKQVKSEVVVLSDPDADAWIDKVDSSWSGALPATLIIKGDNREFHEKPFTYEELESIITKFI